MPDQLLVLADLTDPWSVIASGRVDALVRAGVPVSWGAVARTPTVSITGAPWSADDQDRLDALAEELAAHGIPGEALPKAPSSRPWALPPASALAEASAAGVGDHVRTLLVRAYWRDGRDIGNPDVLRSLLAKPIARAAKRLSTQDFDGYAVAIGGGPVSTAAWRRAREWDGAWSDLGRPELPVVVSGEQSRSGPDALRALRDAMDAHGAPLVADADPYPLPPLRQSWLDQPYPSWVTPWWAA